MASLGERIKALRLERELQQRQLAEKAELTPSMVSQIESGRLTPSLHTLGKIAAALSVPIGALFDAPPAGRIHVSRKKDYPVVSFDGSSERWAVLGAGLFEGKIRAGIATRSSADFLIIARTEALIAGLGEEEALRRAAAYEMAGADMILIHSKKSTPDEIESFVRAWQGKAPLVIVPTAYPQMNEARIRELGKIRMVIYGNHSIRAAVTAMKSVFSRIKADGGIQNVDRDIVTVDEIFRLQRMDRVKENERRFLS